MPQVKHLLYRDPRYDAVRSSSVREDLFDEYVRELASGATAEERRRQQERQRRYGRGGPSALFFGRTPPTPLPSSRSPNPILRLALERREEASLREREEQVRRSKDVQTREASHSLHLVKHDESVRTFQALLVELVRVHEVCPGARIGGGEMRAGRLTWGAWVRTRAR